MIPWGAGTYFALVGDGTLYYFGEVISLIFNTGALVYKKKTLFYSLPNPIEYHISCL